MSKKHIADTLREYREKAGISVKDVAERFGKSVKTIYSWESGQGQPDASTLVELCFWYGIDSFSALSEERENEEPESNQTNDHQQLICIYNKLNPNGKAKVVEYATDLSEQKKYTERFPKIDTEIANDICEVLKMTENLPKMSPK